MRLTFTLSVLAFTGVALAGENLRVKIVARQNMDSQYTYVVPEYSNAQSKTDVNCNSGLGTANCTATTRTTGTTTPARTGSFQVTGATFSLLLPDGRTAVVNCESKYAMHGDGVNRRSCRMPLIDDIDAEFNKDNAKLKWPVSIDGKKLESETYKIIAVFPKREPKQQ